MKFHEKILNLRKSKGYSQDELAQKLGVSRQSISKWENGEAMPEVDKIVALANIFQITTDALLKDEVTKEEVTEEKNHVDRNISAIERLIKRNGYMVGYYIIYSSIGAIFFGVVGSMMFGAFNQASGNFISSFPGDFDGMIIEGGNMSMNVTPLSPIVSLMQIVPILVGLLGLVGIGIGIYIIVKYKPQKTN